MKLLKFLFPILLMFIGCGKSESEKNLDRKAKELEVREEQVLAREQQVSLKESELSKMQGEIDSIQRKADTIGVNNPELVGTWQISMTCTETTCEGSAVGDTKTEQWRILYENNQVIVQAMVNRVVIRIYKGLFKENSLHLKALKVSEQDADINVSLSPHSTTKGLMEGQRIIIRGNLCRTVYTLKAEKQ